MRKTGNKVSKKIRGKPVRTMFEKKNIPISINAEPDSKLPVIKTWKSVTAMVLGDWAYHNLYDRPTVFHVPSGLAVVPYVMCNSEKEAKIVVKKLHFKVKTSASKKEIENKKGKFKRFKMECKAVFPEIKLTLDKLRLLEVQNDVPF